MARLAVRLEGEGGPRSHGPAAGGPQPAFDWAAVGEHCRIAWLRGRFLARGSLSLATGRTHLEFVVAPEEAPVLAARLADLGLPGGWRLRRGRGVVTWKGADVIVTFLRRAGASAAVLELESRLVTRQLHGQLNRVLNAETSNLSRAVEAATRQQRAIAALESMGQLATLPPFDRAVAQARSENPDATLAELAAELEVTRARAQRALERLEAAAARAADGSDVG